MCNQTVMIVEDDDAIRESVAMVVEGEGYQVIQAHNGREALDLLRQDGIPEPCVILLDLMMPEMSGWEFLEIRRNADVIASIPVVVMSAVADRGRLPGGGVKVLRKPMDLDVITRNLRELCSPDSRRQFLESNVSAPEKRAA